MSLDGSHNLQILRGLSSSRSLLSCNNDGSEVNLWSGDDGSGRQVWGVFLVPGYMDTYHIMNKGVRGDRRYLSCAADGSRVDLWLKDDGSGRQRWQFVKVPNPICSYYNIIVEGGVSGGRTVLSGKPDGSKVDLWSWDDGSGLQRWQVQ